jgi:hypothetical protein
MNGELADDVEAYWRPPATARRGPNISTEDGNHRPLLNSEVSRMSAGERQIPGELGGSIAEWDNNTAVRLRVVNGITGEGASEYTRHTSGAKRRTGGEPSRRSSGERLQESRQGHRENLL